MTVRLVRCTNWRASSRVVLPLPTAIVWPSETSWAAAAANRRFSISAGVSELEGTIGCPAAAMAPP